jgi:hypothetical protein
MFAVKGSNELDMSCRVLAQDMPFLFPGIISTSTTNALSILPVEDLELCDAIVLCEVKTFPTNETVP